MFGFQTAAVGKTVHLNSDFVFDRYLTSSKGKITNVARNAAGGVAVIYAEIEGIAVVLGSDAVLTVV